MSRSIIVIGSGVMSAVEIATLMKSTLTTQIVDATINTQDNTPEAFNYKILGNIDMPIEPNFFQKEKRKAQWKSEINQWPGKKR